MTMKPNPGCAIPEIKQPPSIETFLRNLATSVAQKALTTPAAQQAVRVKQAADAQTAWIERETRRVNKAQEQLERFEKLPCPLPNVPDKEATP